MHVKGRIYGLSHRKLLYFLRSIPSGNAPPGQNIEEQSFPRHCHLFFWKWTVSYQSGLHKPAFYAMLVFHIQR